MREVHSLEEWKGAIYCKIIEEWCFEDVCEKYGCPHKDTPLCAIIRGKIK